MEPRLGVQYVTAGGVLTTEGYQLLLSLMGGGGGSAAWGSITGTLSSQADLAAALAGKSNVGHTHPQSDITGLVAALAGKADTVHTHALADLTQSGATLNDVVTWDGTDWVPQAPSGGGGAGVGGTVALDFGAAPGGSYLEETVIEASVTAASRVKAWVSGSTADHNAVEHALIAGAMGLSVVPGTGQFTIYAASDLRLSGEVALTWEAA